MLREHGARAIAISLPEVPLDAREALVRLATIHGSFRVASFTSSELAGVIARGVLRDVDLIALNRDEAAVLAPTLPAAVDHLRAENPRILVAVTAGSEGSWSWDGDELRHLPAPRVPVEGTAGAGDALLAGIVAGLAGGLDLQAAHELGCLVAAMSVTSRHSIDERIGPGALVRFAADHAITLSAGVRACLLEAPAGVTG